MSLFQRRSSFSDPVQVYYTVGLNRTIVLVGLGNPGKEYDQTRHNIGFDCLDDFVRRNPEMGEWTDKKSLKCQLSTGNLGPSRVICVKPTTFMNLSGEAVQAVLAFYKLPSEAVAVVHDELDIPFGQIRTRVGGSSAGHNGIKSITQHIGDDYGRIRIGIGPKTPAQIDSADFVLQKFADKESKQLDGLKRECSAILSEYTYGTTLNAETRSFLV